MEVKKRKSGNARKKSNPVRKFTFFVFLFAIAGIFIFYCMDNPQFLANIKSKLTNPGSEDLSDERGGAVSDISSGEQMEQSVETEENVGAIETGEDGEGSEVESAGYPDEGLTGEQKSEVAPEAGQEPENTSTGAEGEAMPFWKRIMNFFKGLVPGEETDEKEAYPSRIEANIYFCTMGNEKRMIAEKREIIAGSPENAVKNAVLELLRGPAKSYHFPVIPGGTELIEVEIYQNHAKINFSQEFLENSLDTRILDEYIIYTIVNTITELPDIQGVVFYIDGKRIKVYGNVDLSIPAIRNSEFLESEDGSESEDDNESEDNSESDDGGENENENDYKSEDDSGTGEQTGQ